MMFLEKVPMPVAGVALAVATLGGLFRLYGFEVRPVLGIVSAVLLALPLLQCLCVRGQFSRYMSSPVMASIIGTFSMAVIVLSGYLRLFSGTLAFVVFLIGGVLHTLLIGWFTCRFLFKVPVSGMLTSWFILYVGYAVLSIVSPVFGLQGTLGQWIFWFSLTMYLVLMPFMVWRYWVFRGIPEPVKPLVCIYAAPPALCLAAYLQITAEPATWLVWLLAALSFTSLVVVVCFLPGLLRLSFYPSYAAFTFPFAISAMAGRLLELFCIKAGGMALVWHWIAVCQTVLASALTAYVLLRYLMAIARGTAEGKPAGG